MFINEQNVKFYRQITSQIRKFKLSRIESDEITFIVNYLMLYII